MWPESIAVPDGRAVRGALVVPPSKSVSNRLCNLALVAWQPVTLVRPLLSDDIRRFREVLVQLGFEVGEAAGVAPGEEIVLRPPTEPRAEASLDCGESGTLLRFLVAALITLPGRFTVDGSARLRERPLAPLLASLRQLGARITCLGSEGFAPLVVDGPSLRGGRTGLDAGSSSQFLSALLMAACRAESPVEIEVRALTSQPYVELTLDLLARQGARVTRPSASSFRVEPVRLAGGRLEVEGDFSAAAYPAAAAALTGGVVHLAGLRRDSRQGDRRLLDLLARMGARVAWDESGVEVQGSGELVALDEPCGDIPDQVPTLAALAPFARGTTRLRDAAHLRVKESDRLRAMASELTRLGALVEERADGLVIPGLWADAVPPHLPVRTSSWNDHRIAMSCALVGLRRPGLSVGEPGVVEKSYPRFWSDLGALLGVRLGAP